MTRTSFLWKSSDAHGIHSPFVYDFTANGLYGRPKVKTIKNSIISANALQTLFTVMGHFKAFKLMVLGDNTKEITNCIRETGEMNNTQMWFFSPLASVPGGADLIILSGNNIKELDAAFNRGQEDANNTTVFCITDIHSNAKIEKAWLQLCNKKEVSVSIDTYNLGLLFIRKGQAKQHFYIRTKVSGLTNFILGTPKLWGLLG